MTKSLEAIVRSEERVRTLRLAASKLLVAAAELAPVTVERLTEREVEILRLVAAGESNKDIAADLFISESTVKTHLKSVYRKLGARNAAHAVAMAYDQGFMQIGDVA